jgi:regulator of protease activity HflC (stomatin/prohibitin superfamily)
MDISFGNVSLILFIVALVFVFKTINVVPQQHAWVVERLGKYHATLGPGLNIVIPFIDRIGYKHVLKEIPLHQLGLAKVRPLYRRTATP